MTATRTLPSPVQSQAGQSWSALTVLMAGTFMFVLDSNTYCVRRSGLRQRFAAMTGGTRRLQVSYLVLARSQTV